MHPSLSLLVSASDDMSCKLWDWDKVCTLLGLSCLVILKSIKSCSAEKTIVHCQMRPEAFPEQIASRCKMLSASPHPLKGAAGPEAPQQKLWHGDKFTIQPLSFQEHEMTIQMDGR